MAIKLAQFIVGLAIIILIVWKLDVPLAYLTEIGVAYWLFLAFLSLCMLLALSAQFRIILSSVNLFLSKFDSFFLTASNSLFNLILPFKAGLLLRAAFMKRYYQVSLADYSILMVFSQVFSLVCVFCVLFAVAYFDSRVERLAYELAEWKVVAYLVLGVFASLLMLLVLRWLKASKEVSFKPCWFLGVALASSAFTVLSGLRLMISASAVTGSGIDYTSVYFLLACFSGASLVFSLTPGNIGVREGLLIAAGSFLGVPVGEVVQVALLDRLVSSFVVVFVGGFSTIQLVKKVRKEGGV